MASDKRKRKQKLYRYDQWGHRQPASLFERILARLGLIRTHQE